MPIADIENAEIGSSVRGKLNSVIAAVNAEKETLTADRTYYVRTDGNDSNDGLTNSSGGAWATWQEGMDYVAANLIIPLGVTVTILAGNTGTWTATLVLKKWDGGGTLIFEGDTTTPANVTISVASNPCIRVDSATFSEFTIRGFRLINTTAGSSVLATEGGFTKINFSSMNFGAAVDYHIRNGADNKIDVIGNYTISGAAAGHAYSENYGTLRLGRPDDAASTITVTGSPAFSFAFAVCIANGQILAYNQTYSGSATGARIFVVKKGTILTRGGAGSGSLSYFPGNSNGTEEGATFGIYDSV
jgi:hypothetical protein